MSLTVVAIFISAIVAWGISTFLFYWIPFSILGSLITAIVGSAIFTVPINFLFKKPDFRFRKVTFGLIVPTFGAFLLLYLGVEAKGTVKQKIRVNCPAAYVSHETAKVDVDAEVFWEETQRRNFKVTFISGWPFKSPERPIKSTSGITQQEIIVTKGCFRYQIQCGNFDPKDPMIKVPRAFFDYEDCP